MTAQVPMMFEISPASADRLREGSPVLEVEYGGRRAAGRVESMACTCRKAGGSHEHHFVASELLKALRASAEVEIRLEEISTDDPRTVRVAVRPID